MEQKFNVFGLSLVAYLPSVRHMGNFVRNTVIFPIEEKTISQVPRLFTNTLQKILFLVKGHKGLEDVRIEAKILAWCYSRKKQKVETNINRACWRKLVRETS